MNPLLNTALSYAARNWRVIPLHHVDPNGSCSCGRSSCRPGAKESKSIGKHPILKTWQKDATTDQNLITSWWTYHPQANIGIATGNASNLLVLDVDVHNHKPGLASLARLYAELGPLPRTRAQSTGSGGKHFLFKHPPGILIRNAAGWRGAVGIDWRGDGGQIVAPPSVTPAGRYAWTDLGDPAELPAAWVEALMEWMARIRTPARSAPALAPKAPNNVDLAGDDEAIANALACANGDKFKTLWEGKWEDAGYESQSNADLALCSLIAFWCDMDEPEPDPDRIDRIMERSGLYRDKWNREDYRARTITIAVEGERERRRADKMFAEGKARAAQATLVGAGVESAAATAIAIRPPNPPSAPQTAPALTAHEMAEIELKSLRRKISALSSRKKSLAKDSLPDQHGKLEAEANLLGNILHGKPIHDKTSFDRARAIKKAANLLAFCLPIHAPIENVRQILRASIHAAHGEDRADELLDGAEAHYKAALRRRVDLMDARAAEAITRIWRGI